MSKSKGSKEEAISRTADSVVKSILPEGTNFAIKWEWFWVVRSTSVVMW